MNPAAFQELNSTYYVNRRRKEAIIQPLQSIISDLIATQLANLHTFCSRLKHSHITIPQDLGTPNLQDITLDSIFRAQEVALQEIEAQTERAIEIILANAEDVDPLSSEWTVLALHNNNQGQQLVQNPTIYLPLNFYRVKDLQGQERSIPVNPSEYLPSDEEYFEATGALDPPTFVIPSNLSYLESRVLRNYATNNADLATNKFYCCLEPPPPVSNQSLSLPHQGDTYLRDGSPFYKKLDKGDTIYIPQFRKYGEVLSWRFNKVSYKPTWIFTSLSPTAANTDHWQPVPASDPTEQTPFGSFVINVPSSHPTRRLFAYVSPYTASDSDFLAPGGN